MSSYLPGDTISRRKGLVKHQGVALGDGRVLHNIPGRGEHISTEAEFSLGRKVSVVQRSRAEREHALSSAASWRASRRYSLFTNNCEHTVNRASSGRAKSPQLRGWVAGVGLAGAAIVLTRHPGLAAAGFALGKKWGNRSGKR